MKSLVATGPNLKRGMGRIIPRPMVSAASAVRGMGSSGSNSGMMTPDEEVPATIPLIGSSKFLPLPQVKSILVTGGGGFM